MSEAESEFPKEIVSIPPAPFIISAPPAPLIMSSPVPAVIVSACAPPVMVRLSVCPVRSITVEVEARFIELIFWSFASVAKECEPFDKLNVSVPDPPSIESPSPWPALETVIISPPPPP